MIVLGIGAWVHDSAAALMVDGELIGHIEEDRLSGEKHTRAFPEHALDWLLASAGIDAGAVDVVGYPFAPHPPSSPITAACRSGRSTLEEAYERRRAGTRQNADSNAREAA